MRGTRDPRSSAGLLGLQGMGLHSGKGRFKCFPDELNVQSGLQV